MNASNSSVLDKDGLDDWVLVILWVNAGLGVVLFIFNASILLASKYTSGEAQDERRVCKFYATRAGCFRGEMCPWEHTINPEGVVTTDKDQVFSASDVEHSVTLPKVSSWVVIDITAIRSPNHFYVNFPFGVLPLEQYKELTNGKDEGYSESISSWENFENLLEQLNEHYSRMTYRNVDLTEFALGEIIIAKFSTDGSWNRAKVINSNSDLEKVEVFYVDFGNAEWVSEKDTRRIELKFMQMPFLAVECFLNNVEPASDNGIWSKEARNLFSQLTEGRTLFANVISKGSNSTVFLDLYDTSGNEEVNIGEELRKAGFAKKTEGLCTKKKVEGITYLPG